MTSVIIGGGPAGIVCAIGLAAAGQSVTLVDENLAQGGHLRYDPYDPADSSTSSIAWRTELAEFLEQSGAVVRVGTVAWAAYRSDAGFEILLSSDNGPETLETRHLIIASGTTDRELSVPGATLPGVMTERAARILIELHGVIPGSRCAVVGTDIPRMDRLVQFLERSGVSTRSVPTTDVGKIGGTDGVEFLKTTSGDRIPVDFVVIARGERPDTQLAGMLEAERVFRSHLDGWTVPNFDCGRGLYVVGGALTGSAIPAEYLSSAARTVQTITGSGFRIPERMAMTSILLSALPGTQS